MKVNPSLVKSTIVAALGGLLFGFDTAVISGTTAALTQNYQLLPKLLGITVASALWGTVIGSLLAGFPGEWIGRRDSLRLMAILYLISGLGCAAAWSWPSLVGFRFLGGLGIGGSSVLGPMYIAEIAPARLRGRLVGVFQFNVVFGILLAYFSNYLIGLRGFGAAEWRWELGVTAIPAALFFLMLFGIPRSPRWLAKKGRITEARGVLQMIGEENFEQELQEIVESIRVEQHQGFLLWLLIGYIAFFAFSQGAVIWVYLSEVFPNNVRAKGQSLGSFTHWIMNALISGTFPLMAASSGGYPFIFFSLMMIVQFFVVLFVYPETKGITLEEMQKKLTLSQAH